MNKLDVQSENTLKNLINKFKLFLYESVKDNNEIKEEIKKDIIFVLDTFITNDIYAFKNIIKMIIKNKEQHLNKFKLNVNQFTDERKLKFEKYLNLFKEIYNIE